jgi:hypothetical protein
LLVRLLEPCYQALVGMSVDPDSVKFFRIFSVSKTT